MSGDDQINSTSKFGIVFKVQLEEEEEEGEEEEEVEEEEEEEEMERK